MESREELTSIRQGVRGAPRVDAGSTDIPRDQCPSRRPIDPRPGSPGGPLGRRCHPAQRSAARTKPETRSHIAYYPIRPSAHKVFRETAGYLPPHALHVRRAMFSILQAAHRTAVVGSPLYLPHNHRHGENHPRLDSGHPVARRHPIPRYLVCDLVPPTLHPTPAERITETERQKLLEPLRHVSESTDTSRPTKNPILSTFRTHQRRTHGAGPAHR